MDLLDVLYADEVDAHRRHCQADAQVDEHEDDVAGNNDNFLQCFCYVGHLTVAETQ